MASACVNKMGMSPEKFLDCSPTTKYKSYGWLSPRMSFSNGDTSKVAGTKKTTLEDKTEKLDPEVSNDFEFCLEDPVIMLPADQLFSDGKLVPLHLSMTRPVTTTSANVTSTDSTTPQVLRMRNEISNADPYLFSPKAPRCTTRWRELLGLKKQHQNNNNAKLENQRTSSLPSNTKSLKNFLHRSSKSLSSSLDSSLNLPLLTKDSDTESVSISSRLSLSSSSSGHDHDDLPRLSLDSDRPNRNATNPRRVRLVKHRVSASEATRTGRSPVRRQTDSTLTTTVRGASVDSPRMNSSGKIVFHSLERSSSSPSTFNGGPRYKHRGMERSYSANVRVTPVLNVPVCKSGVFGFPLFSSSSSSVNGNKGQYHSNSRPKTVKE
ncbi:uncharacterized protein LOC132037251 [Lycium ferocissimum]|uniref:uncharacterized protein LOC132037251 n=1 Tax=Lycium ferocissimum TaxID=112874 RepID=UPI002816357C|nr:uncharacterized protein LOC132037251 [Lycium ferocissimum]